LLEAKQKVKVDYQKCHPKKCDKGVCLAVRECPKKLWKQEDPYDLPYVIPGFCDNCGRCIEVCPEGAIQEL
jgi:NAD-dependent dihydropyrimidine dehydrogenase PreA subunit